MTTSTPNDPRPCTTNQSRLNGNRRILVVDDSAGIHDDYRKILVGSGSSATDDLARLESDLFGSDTVDRWFETFDVDFAFQGEEGLELVRKAKESARPFAVAFVDVRMPPGWDGIETAERLWQVDPDLLVVICSAHSDYSWGGLVDRLGVNDRWLILRKPFDAVEVRQLALAMTQKWESAKENREYTASLEDVVQERTAALREEMAKLREAHTERKHLEDSLRQAQKMEAIGQLTGGIAHDFNNVLSTIMVNSHFLVADLARNDPRREDAEAIKAAADRAASLTRQLLAFSRKQVLQPTVLNLNTVVTDLEKMLRRLIGEDVEFWVLPGRDLGSTRVDLGQLEQVIVNLVVNARDAMPTGGRLLIETANVDVDQHHAESHPSLTLGKYIMLSVTDTGVGMDEVTQQRIFEPFFTTKAPDKGTGLGLSTCYGIIKQSAGHIWVNSEPGHGTVFKVYLPRVDDRPTLAVRRSISRGLGGGETILVIEDDTQVRAAAIRILKGYGYAVLDAPGGTRALAIADDCRGIDLVLSDVVMPGANGPEVVEQLRKRFPLVKSLFMSGYTDHAVLSTGALHGNVNFLQKPFVPHALAKQVRETLDSRPA